MIKRIAFRGIGSYGEDLQTVEFGEGKNIIVGENGAGKSALLFAIEVGFLGKLEGWDLRDVINDDAEEAEVMIDFTLPQTEQELQICRKFRRIQEEKQEKGRQTEAFLKDLDTGRILANGPENVERYLKEIGIDKNVFLNIIHIKQGRIDKILIASAEQREMFDRLFGIDDIKNALEKLGSRRGETYSGQLRELDNKRRANKEKILELETLAKDYDDKEGELNRHKEEKKKLELEKDQLEKEHEEITKLYRLIEALVKKAEEIKNNKRKYENFIEQSNKILDNLYKQLEKTNKHLYEEIRKIRFEDDPDSKKGELIVALIEQRIKEIEESEKNKSELIQQKENVEGELNQLRANEISIKERIKEFNSQIERIKKFLEGKEEAVEIKCELCGSLLKPSQYIEHLKEVEGGLSKKENESQQIKARIEEKNKHLENIKKKIDEIEAHEIEKTSLSHFRDTIGDEIKSICDSLEHIKEHEKELNKILGEISLHLNVPGDKVDNKLDEIESKYLELPYEIKNCDEKIKNEEERIRDLEKEVEYRREAKEKAEKLKRENEEITRKIDFLEKVIRPTLEDIQPLVRKLFIDSINKRAEVYFEKFYGKDSKHKRADIERIWMDEEYRFWVDRLGHEKQASRLSGGQSIVVSLCFLFALLDELGSSMGFILLDEPSNHLDDKRVEELIEVLKSLQNVPQLIIVDHKRELILTADVRYEVLLENGFSQIRQIE